MTSIQTILTSAERQPDGRMPVVFNGKPARLLGYAHSYAGVDTLAIAAGVSATFISRATVTLPNGETSQQFFIMHG